MKPILKFSLLIGILFATSTTLIAQTLTSIDPDNAQQGQSLSVTITGQNTHFAQGSPTVNSVWFSQGSPTINASSSWPYSDISLSASFNIPINATTGLWDVIVYNSIDGTLTLPGGFTVTSAPSPALTSIVPNNAQQGQSLSVTITGQNTNFMQGSSTTVTSVWFAQGSSTINASSFWANSPTSASANFNIPGGASTGSWDVKVTDTIDGTLTLSNGFTITGTGELTVVVWTSGNFVSGEGDWSRTASVPIHVQVLDYEDEPVGGAGILMEDIPCGQTDIDGCLDFSWSIPDSSPIEGSFSSKAEALWYNLSGESELVTLYNMVKLTTPEPATLSASEAFMYNIIKLLEHRIPAAPAPPKRVWVLYGVIVTFFEHYQEYWALAGDVVNVEIYECTATDVDPAWLIRETVVRDGQIFLELNSWTENKAKYYEAIYPIPGQLTRGGMLITLASPATLYVTAPDGSHAGYDPLTGEPVSDFPIAISQRGDEPFLLFIPHPAHGDYLINVIPEPDALPTDTFTLVVNKNGIATVLARDLEIRNIPETPYRVAAIISADVEIHPDVLQLKSKGRWITCYIWLPEEYNVSDIDSDSVLLEDEIEAEWIWVEEEEQVAMAKFNRSDIQQMLVELGLLGEVELTVTGELKDGTKFVGTDTIRVIANGGKKK